MAWTIRVEPSAAFADTDVRCVELSSLCKRSAEARATREFTKRYGRQALREATVVVVRERPSCGNE